MGTRPGWPRSGLPGTVSDEVAHLVTDLVALDPAERPASAGQVAARAKGLLDHPMRPLAGRPTGPTAYCSGNRCRNYRKALSLDPLMTSAGTPLQPPPRRRARQPRLSA